MKLKTQQTNLPDGCIMTLKDVVDTINNGREVKPKEKGFLQHGQAKSVTEKLSQTPSFGGVKKSLTRNLNEDNNLNKSIETYALTKKQAIASAAKLDSTMLMQVIDKIEKSTAYSLELNCRELEEEVLILQEDILRKRIKRVELLQEMGCKFDPSTIINQGYID